MKEAINAYRHIAATPEFRQLEQMRADARHNEAAALNHAREQGMQQEREKWQTAVADKDAEIAELKRQLEKRNP